MSSTRSEERTNLLTNGPGSDPDQWTSAGAGVDLRTHVEIKLYSRRWWILFVYCFASIVQGMIWNTWAPLTYAVVIAFDWTEGDVTTIQALSCLVFIVSTFPILYIIETYGLRAAMLLTISGATLGCIAWIVAVNQDWYWLMAVGAPFVGLGICATLTAPSFLSLSWFPVNERNTATGLASIAVYTGVGLGFITGPQIIGSHVTTEDVMNKHSHTAEYIDGLSSGIANVTYFVTGLPAANLLLIAIYFPSKPPQPPSQSQAAPRMGFWEGIKHVSRVKQLWLLNAAFNASVGIFNSWLPLVSINLRPVGVDQSLAGWIGFTSMPASMFGSLILSRIAERCKKKLKVITMVSTTIALVQIGVIACFLQGYIVLPGWSSTKALLCILYSGICACLNGVVPLYYEIGCEMAYPAHEALIGAFLQIVQLMVIGIYFLLLLNKNLATYTGWMNWTLFTSTLLTLVMLFLIHEQYPRLELDNEEDEGRER